MNLIKIILNNKGWPKILNFSNKIYFLYHKPITKFINFNLEIEKQIDKINFNVINDFNKEPCSYLFDYNNIYYVN